MYPSARQNDLLVQEVGDELVVYDQDSRRVHRLNRATASIWRHCDGNTDVPTLAVALQTDAGVPETSSQDLVRFGLDQLSAANLLQNAVAPSGLTRRQLMKGAVVGGLLLVPVVSSIMAPTPAMAISLVTPPAASTDSGSSDLTTAAEVGAVVVGTGLVLSHITPAQCSGLASQTVLSGAVPCHGPNAKGLFCKPDPQTPGKFKCS